MENRREQLENILGAVCIGPLKRLFTRCARSEQGDAFTSLNSYIQLRKSEIEHFLHEYEKGSNRLHFSDIEKVVNAIEEESSDLSGSNSFGVSLLAFLLNLFKTPPLSAIERRLITSIDNIQKELRPNQLLQKLDDEESRYIFKKIEIAVPLLANQVAGSAYERDVRTLLNENRRVMFPGTAKRTSDGVEKDIREEISEIKNKTIQTKRIIGNLCVPTQDRRGGVGKRIRTVDYILNQLHEQLKVTFDQQLPADFQPPPEVEDVKLKLSRNHYVVVTGYNDVYLTTALVAIKELGYTFSRCVEIRRLSDWRHVDPEDVDLVLFREPFSLCQHDNRELHDVFDNMQYSACSANGEKSISVVITSDVTLLKTWTSQNDHDLFEDMVEVKQLTNEHNPIDLTGRNLKPAVEVMHPILRNMIEQTEVLRRHVERYEPKTDLNDFHTAKDLIKKHKSILILGKRDSGKTALAVKLMSLYPAGQCLIVTDPSEWKHAQLGTICTVIVEDFAGRYSYDKKVATSWLSKFDQMFAAVVEGKLNLIITCGTEQFSKFMTKFSSHPLLEPRMTLTGGKTVIKQEPLSPLGSDIPNVATSSEVITSSTDIPNVAASSEVITSATDLNWDTCIKVKCESTAQILLHHDQLPSKIDLEKICKHFGMKSNVLMDVCKKISEKIKGLSEKIINVWPAYRKDKEERVNLAFVICSNEDIHKDLRNKVGYEFKERIIGKCSTEGKAVTFSRENAIYQMSTADKEKIKSFIDKNSTHLLKKHKMLSVISASSIKSQNHGRDDWTKSHCPCLVFYVHTKNYIPIDEDPFKEKYEGIPVDVREGAFLRLGRSGDCSEDFAPNVEIGAEIRGTENSQTGLAPSGTLSGFIELPDIGTCGFTCAHTVVPADVLEEVAVKGPPAGKQKLFVYQPADSEEVLGSVSRVVYHEGGDGKPGFEIAIIKLQKARHPLSGKISDYEDQANQYRFESGAILQTSDIHMCEKVLKFGCSTGNTDGQVAFDGATIREIPFSWNYDGVNIILKNQLEVWPTEFHQAFAKKGDSGGPVFAERNGELHCVGIIEGGVDCGFCAVTPVEGILKDLNIRSMKDFRTIHHIRKGVKVPVHQDVHYSKIETGENCIEIPKVTVKA